MIRAKWLLLLVIVFAGPANAQTLQEAIIRAYETNPELAEARARQEAVSERPEQARAQVRPTLSAVAGAGYDELGFREAGTASVRANYPIWTGGRAASAIEAARFEVLASQQRIRDVEAAVLQGVVTAYAELLFAQQAVNIAEIGIDRLDRQILEARLRFDLGEGTRTDVAQLQAQRAAVASNLASSEAARSIGVAAYRAVVGDDPGVLSVAQTAPGQLPADLQNARRSALRANPLVIEREYIAGASAARIGGARAERAPRIDVVGNYGRGITLNGGSRLNGFESEAAVGVSFGFPLFTGGLVPSRIREARAINRADEYAVEAEVREATRLIESSWASLRSAETRLFAATEGLAAAEQALDGVRAEYEFGLRSTLDILIADQSFRDAQLSLARANSDLMVGQAAVLRAAGLLDRDSFETEPGRISAR